MRFSTAILLAALAGVASAHFQLQFPAPRGAFVEDDEPNFCDGYTEVTTNRTVFPLTGGFFTLNSEHPQWTAGVTLATAEDPNTFDDFKLVNNFFKVNGEGEFCIPLDFKTSNATGLQNNQNVTIQIVFSGGDGNLYQCADLTLSDSAKISSDVTCSNGTASSASSSAGSSSGTNTATSSTTSQTGKSPAVPLFSTSTLAVASAFIAAVSLAIL